MSYPYIESTSSVYISEGKLILVDGVIRMVMFFFFFDNDDYVFIIKIEQLVVYTIYHYSEQLVTIDKTISFHQSQELQSFIQLRKETTLSFFYKNHTHTYSH